MGQYDFSTLNDKDFEELVRDLLTQELSVRFQSFKVGKDKGIDLRYSTVSSENKIIVQVKHYYKSGYNKLIYTLKNQEKVKIDLLNPQRYIIATSIGLSPTDKEKIKTTLSPYILNTNDIYGSDDLNGLLSQYPGIEKKHSKLWFSNVNIIQKIINNGIEGRSAFIEEKIRKDLGIYVVNDSYDKALNILREKKILLITGIPGIGKTSLANLITYHLLSKDFRLVYIDDKIKDAEDVFDNNREAKQLFYFDDFLGSNYLDVIHNNTDKSIVNFIERIKVTKNKYLILTTRSTILNQAKSKLEKLNLANLDSLKYEIEIIQYSEYDKAKILYNHLFFNDLKPEFVKEIFKDKNYWKIIRHKNYNPRLIEYFTKESNICHLKDDEYLGFILSNLNNPEKIWESAFDNQLDKTEKFLIFTLLSFGSFAFKDNLMNAFEARIDYEILNHGYTREVNAFNKALKNLMDGYLTNNVFSVFDEGSYLDFINPSLRDYLISFFNKNNIEKWRLIESFVYIEQFKSIFRIKEEAKNNIIIEKNEIKKFVEIANSTKVSSVYYKDQSNINLGLLSLFFSYRNRENSGFIDEIILKRLNEIDWININISQIENILYVIENIDVNSKIYILFKDNWECISEKLFKAASSDSQLSRVKALFNKVGINYTNYRSTDSTWKNTIFDTITRIFTKEADKIVDKKQGGIFSEEDFSEMGKDVSICFEEMRDKYLPSDEEMKQPYDPCENIDYDELISENSQANVDEDEDDWSYSENSQQSSITIIDDLFSCMEK